MARKRTRGRRYKRNSDQARLRKLGAAVKQAEAIGLSVDINDTYTEKQWEKIQFLLDRVAEGEVPPPRAWPKRLALLPGYGEDAMRLSDRGTVAEWLDGDYENVHGVNEDYVDLDTDGRFHYSHLSRRRPDEDDIEERPEDYLFLPEGLGYHDDDGPVPRSNVAFFMETVEEIEERGDNISGQVFMLYGGMGTTQVGVRLTADHPEILDMLEGLAGNHVLSDDALAEVEQELRDQAWRDHYRESFGSALEGAFDIEIDWDVLDDIEDEEDEQGDPLWQLMRTIEDYEGIYGYASGSSWHWPLDRYVAAAELEDLDDAGVPYAPA